ncbi:MAG: sulfatase-like hydrolase/transferase, partial [Firmicutes bacterium]|nr:sulfatase-like hydrolase/transferase [Bacillota bacterium]
AVRAGDWKVVFMEQRAEKMQCWAEPFVKFRMPKMFNLRRDPFERADENSNTYWDWYISHLYIMYAIQLIVVQQIESFKEFPPSQKPQSWNLDAVLEQLKNASSSASH